MVYRHGSELTPSIDNPQSTIPNRQSPNPQQVLEFEEDRAEGGDKRARRPRGIRVGDRGQREKIPHDMVPYASTPRIKNSCQRLCQPPRYRDLILIPCFIVSFSRGPGP